MIKNKHANVLSSGDGRSATSQQWVYGRWMIAANSITSVEGTTVAPFTNMVNMVDPSMNK